MINAFTKQIFVQGIPNKSAPVVLEAVKVLLKKSKRKFTHINTDRGKEFTNSLFKNYCKNILKSNLYFSFSSKKCALAERYLGILKNKIYRQMALRGSPRYIDILDKIVQKMNNSKHSRMKLSPNEINRMNEKFIYDKFYNRVRPIVKPKYKVGQYVRIAYGNEPFEKSYYAQFSPQIYKIAKINYKYPNVYKLTDIDGKLLPQSFYQEQLNPTKYHDIYLIREILKEKNGKLLVAWMGYNDKFNSWIDKKDIYEAERS